MTRACGYYIESALRDPHKIVGNSPAFVDYILRRFKESEVVTDQDMRMVARQALLSLVVFGNIIVSRRRNVKACSGKSYKRFDGKEFEPVAGYFVEDPRAFVIEKANNGQVVYRRVAQKAGSLPYSYSVQGQSINVPFGSDVYDKDKIFQKEDIIHIRYHPIPGNVWGMPPFLGVCDDLVTLRSIEECVGLLVYQYGHPFLHAAIGKENITGTDPEITSVKREIEAMEGNGMLVTNDRVKITNITNGSGIDMRPYLDYFKSRAFAGLNISGNVAGEGETANKDSSFSMSKVQSGFTTELQTHMRMMYTHMVNDFKYEFPLPITRFFHPQYEISAEYPEVDINSKILLENHLVNSFAQNVITRTEARQEMGRKTLAAAQEADMFNKLVTQANVEQEGKFGLEQTRLAAAMRPKTTTSLSTKKPANKKAQNKVTPSNQHGTKTTNTPKKG